MYWSHIVSCIQYHFLSLFPSFSFYPLPSPTISLLTLFSTNQSKGDGKDTTLLILDRSVDLCVPLLHAFTYQAMVQDLIPLAGHHEYTCVFGVELGVGEEV